MGRDESCVLCHHMNKPYDRNTGCYKCHSDMYLKVDVFDHRLHTDKIGGNKECHQCHADELVEKTRDNTKNCLECHKTMVVVGSRVEVSSPRINSMAAGYMDALHKLCIDCHKETEQSRSLPADSL